MDQNIMMINLIDELEQVVLRWVHAHRPHGPAQLLGADVSAPVNVKLIERLQSRIYNIIQNTSTSILFSIVSCKRFCQQYLNLADPQYSQLSLLNISNSFYSAAHLNLTLSILI